MTALSNTSSLSSQLDNLARSGGRLVVASSNGSTSNLSTTLASGLTPSDTKFLEGLTGIPFNSSGEPDFDSARASGTKITGGVPGGYDVASICIDGNVVEFFAGQVASDRKSGALNGDLSSHYVKGMMLSVSDKGTEASHRQFIKMAMDYLDRLSPDDVASSPNYTPRATFETSVSRSSFEARG